MADNENDGEINSEEVIKLPFAKILLDKFVSLILLALTLPLSLFIVLAIKIDGLIKKEDRGTIFFIEKRISAGKVFNLYKFRIFKMSAVGQIGKPGVITKNVENIPENLTSFGRVLKKWGLDELPQLFSILKGDMTLVGPRPAPVNEYEAELSSGVYRKKVLRTGLTGPVQIMKGTERNKEQEIAADMKYIKKIKTSGQTGVLWADLKILAKTVKVFLKRTGE